MSAAPRPIDLIERDILIWLGIKSGARNAQQLERAQRRLLELEAEKFEVVS